ncbi:MAG TPA: hypothetical protein VMN76_02965 [Acidobacteriota bacterium]|nr:hypothetical protein [Acidobacteriota bacterium]
MGLNGAPPISSGAQAKGGWATRLVRCWPAPFSCFTLLLLIWGFPPIQAAGTSDACSDADAARVLEHLSCMTANQLQLLISYSNPGSDEHLLREALAAAATAVSCANRGGLSLDPGSLKDLQCLRSRLLDFYRKVAPDRPRPKEIDRTKPRIPTPVRTQEPERPNPLRHQDLLARAATRIHFCMADTTLPIADCLHLVDEALTDYQFVFEAALGVRRSPDSTEAQELAERLGFSSDQPAPDPSHLKTFLDLALDNVLRFPLVLGKRVGAFLRPILCTADELYPEHRDYISHHYNLLVRYDDGNVASAGQIFRLLLALEEMFQPDSDVAGFLRFGLNVEEDAAPPCGPQGSAYFFPHLAVEPGFRFPHREEFQKQLDGIEDLLEKTGSYTERRDHLWQPFYGYASLLSELAARLKISASRSESAWELRHFLMLRARDAFLLRAVGPEKLPRDPRMLQAQIRRHIETYGGELFREARFDGLLEFSEGYLEGDRGLLDESERRILHRLLAVAYTLRGDDEKALSHLQKSHLGHSDLEAVVRQLKSAGIGVSIRP